MHTCADVSEPECVLYNLCSRVNDHSLLQEASVFTTAQEVPYLDMVINETLRLYSPSPRYKYIIHTL